jgi:hypothetical protein
MKDKFIAYEAAVSDKSNIFTAQYLHFVFFFTMHMYSCFTDQKIKKKIEVWAFQMQDLKFQFKENLVILKLINFRTE